jgi:hypothetical protein
MDTITDILTNFFVNPKTKEKSNRKKESKKELKEPELKEPELKEPELKEPELKEPELKEPELKEPEQTEAKKEELENRESEAKKEEAELITKKEDLENREVELKKSKKRFKKNSKELKRKKIITESTESTTNTSNRTSIQDFKKNNSNTSLSSLSSLTSDNSSKDIELNSDFKKYTLKPFDFYKKNIVITSFDKKENISILSDILYKLSLLKKIDSLYHNEICIITSDGNKKMFKQMFLENPYLYFSDFNVKQYLTESDIEKCKESDLDKKRIFIIDNRSIECDTNLNLLKNLVKVGSHIIIVMTDKESPIHIYKVLGDDKLIMYRINKLKSLQKHFYKSVVKKISNTFHTFSSFDKAINNPDLDIRYIIVRDNQTFYN